MASIRRLSEGRYQITWLEGYVVGPDGKRRQVKRSEVVRGTLQDAERRAADIERARVPASKLRDPDERTFWRVAAEWLDGRREEVDKGQLEYGTYRRYEETLRRYALPIIGEIPVSRLQPSDVEACYREAPPGTVRKLHAAMRQVLRWAYRQRWLGWDAAAMIQAPRAPRSKRPPIPPHHARLILLAFQETPHWPMVALAAATGLRIGEILALRWADVDWDNHALWVHRSLKDAETGLVFGSTKQDEAFVVAVDPGVMEVLREHRAEQERLRSRWRQDLGLIFPGPRGGPVHRQNWYRRVWWPVLTTLVEPGQVVRLPLRGHTLRYVARTGDSFQRLAWHHGLAVADLVRANQEVRLVDLPRYVPHQLRHTFVTTALGGADPMPLTAVARAGGWRDVMTPVRLYAGVITEDQRRVAAKAWASIASLAKADDSQTTIPDGGRASPSDPGSRGGSRASEGSISQTLGRSGAERGN